MHFQTTKIPFYPGIPWRRRPTNAHAGQSRLDPPCSEAPLSRHDLHLWTPAPADSCPFGIAALAGQPVGQGHGHDGVEMQSATDVSLVGYKNEPGLAKLMLGPSPLHMDLVAWSLGHSMPKNKKEEQLQPSLYTHHSCREEGKNHQFSLAGPQPCLGWGTHVRSIHFL